MTHKPKLTYTNLPIAPCARMRHPDACPDAAYNALLTRDFEERAPRDPIYFVRVMQFRRGGIVSARTSVILWQ